MRLVRHLAVVVIIAAIAAAGSFGERRQDDWLQVMNASRPLTVYFSTADAQQLVGERRWVRRDEASPGEALRLLLSGPVSPDLVPVIPRGTEVLDLQIGGGTAWVNFSGEIVRHHGGGSAGELVTVYAIVNTLTEFDGIHRVQIVVDGRRVETLAGHVDLTRPLAREPGMIGGVRAVLAPALHTRSGRDISR